MITIIDCNFAGVTGTVADTVESSSAAEVLAVFMAVLTDAVIVGILGDWTLRHAVRAVLHIITAQARRIRLI